MTEGSRLSAAISAGRPVISALIVEDDDSTLDAMRRVLESLGLKVSVAPSLKEAGERIAAAAPDIALVDLGMPDGCGTTLIEELGARGDVDIIVVSGTDDTDDTLACLRAGVADFLQKPVCLADIRRSVGRLIARRAGARVEELDAEPHGRAGPGSIFGESDAGRRLQSDVRAAGRLDSIRLLIQGDPCALMSDVATAVHIESGRKGPVLIINCANETDGAVAERFFGRASGADRSSSVVGYIEQASGGTLVLDEIGRLPLAVQSRLASYARTGAITPIDSSRHMSIDCALIGIQTEPSRQSDNDRAIEEELFRAISWHRIFVPDLSERGGDALSFAERAVSELNRVYSMEKSLSAGFRAHISQHDWPGNMVELRNALFAAYVTTDPYEEILFDPAVFPASVRQSDHTMKTLVGSTFGDLKRELLLATLDHHGGNKLQTARKLGISLKTLYNRMHACH